MTIDSCLLYIDKTWHLSMQMNLQRILNTHHQEHCLGILIPTFCKSTTMTSSFMICRKSRYAKVMSSLFSKCSTIMVRTQDVLATYKKKKTNRKEKKPRDMFFKEKTNLQTNEKWENHIKDHEYLQFLCCLLFLKEILIKDSEQSSPNFIGNNLLYNLVMLFIVGLIVFTITHYKLEPKRKEEKCNTSWDAYFQ